MAGHTKKWIGIVAILCQLFISGYALAYEVGTHAELTSAAYDRSILVDKDFLHTLGLSQETLIDVSRADARRPIENDGSIEGWLRQGAVREDGFNCLDGRPVNHFFDPQNDRPLTVLGRELGLRSPDWALEDRMEAAGQDYSLRDARDRFHEAMTLPERHLRDRAFGLLFQTLGHVMHHVQDMAQPEHVRNDAHLVTPCRPDWLPRDVSPIWEDSSLYEYYTNREHVLRDLPIDGYGALDLSVFDEARKLWEDDRRGMAEFTNYNFVSKDTNFRGSAEYLTTNPEYPSPMAAAGERIRIEDPRLLGPDQRLRGWMQFVASAVSDTYVGNENRNERAATYSIFTQDLQHGIPPFHSFSLNRFNFDAAHEFLMPRAVAYSAALIDHFFRGQLAVVDSVLTGQELMIQVRNDSVAEERMANGRFEIHYDGASGLRKRLVLTAGEEPGSGGLAYGAIQTLIARMPADVDTGTDARFVVTFQGDIGAEGGVAAVVLERPKSGFIIRPYDIPADGITGDRLLSRVNGQWVLDPETGALAAGNVDWKGAYVNGVATRVLTWMGPPGRYHPRQKGKPEARSRSVFRAGEVFAVAPCGVIGAAIQKGTDGREWLLVICPSGSDDVVYRRPAVKDPTATDWELIGVVPAQPDALPADRPWFFNGSGTEAQTMRLLSDKQSLTRLRLRVNGTNFSYENLGNTEITRTRTWSWDYVCEDSPYTVSSHARTDIAGSNVVAVDYVGDTEVLAEYFVEGIYEYELSGIYDDSQHGEITQDRSLRNNLQHVLRIGSRSWPMATYQNMETSHYNGGGMSTGEKNDLYYGVLILFMDLRHGLLIYDDQLYTTSESRSVPPHQYGTAEYMSTEARATVVHFEGAARDAYRSTRTGNGSYAAGMPRSWEDEIGTCFDGTSSNGSGSDTDAVPHSLAGPGWWTIGSYAVDVHGELFTSFGYMDIDGAVRPYHWFSGGDPAVIMGSGSPQSSFHPIRLR
ncbi:MAG: hypothetical protein PHQ14_01470 [Chromatiales bacterium]|nr:hypothetical protein [Chromatiales bacterium]